MTTTIFVAFLQLILIFSMASVRVAQEASKRHALIQTQLNVHQSIIENLKDQLGQNK